MQKPAETQYEIHDLLKNRWSPRAFSSEPVDAEKILSLLEAARWSPSAANEQPWAFIVGLKNETNQTHEKIVGTLADMNAAWAKNAPILVLAIAKVQRTGGAANRYAWYDLGQSVAHLSIQASALGLFVHQMAGFDAEKARQSFDLPEGYEAVTAFAIGYPGNVDDLPEPLRSREISGRSRKPLTDFVFTEQWGNPLVLTPEESEIATA